MQWVRAMLKADKHTVISVTAPECGAAECGSAETIILLMRPDEPTQAIKISKSLKTSPSQTSPKPFSRCSALESDQHSLNPCFKPVKGNAPVTVRNSAISSHRT
jgi:hypothetical protein